MDCLNKQLYNSITTETRHQANDQWPHSEGITWPSHHWMTLHFLWGHRSLMRLTGHTRCSCRLGYLFYHWNRP